MTSKQQGVDWTGSWVAAGGFREVSPRWTAKHQGEVRLVDVREPDELESALGAIEGVENIPMGQLTGAAASWERGAPVVLVCRSGGRSGMMATRLMGMGFTEVASMAGGMIQWGSDGLPVRRG